MKNHFVILRVLLAVLVLSMLYCCKKETPKVVPTVTASAVTNITSNSATAGGVVTADGGDQVTSRGVCWSSTNTIPTTSDSKTSDGSGIGNFSSSISGLNPGTTYNLIAYATNSVGTAYSSPSSFKTQSSAPVISTTDFSSVTSNSFNTGGNVTSDGGSSITARGVCWSTNQNPSITDSKTSDGIGSGTFTSSITGLTPGKTYYVRAYATNSIATSYGNQIIITALANLPTISTAKLVTSITGSSATSGGDITSDGGGAITARGVCWSTITNPTISDNKTSNSTGAGSFISTMTGLTANTTYYVRAFATNSAGTSYGSEVSFKTTANLPTITTNDVTSVTNSTALCGGNITYDGGATITGRGVCWSTSHNPTFTDSKTSDGIGSGTFTSSISLLTSGTQYYVRSYAQNSAGIEYGNEVSFTTIEMLPSVTTTSATSINENMALCGGNIISSGGHSITNYGIIIRDKATGSYGVDYNLGSNYSSFTGKFSALIPKLAPDTEYNFYAFVTTSAGTSTGDVMTFRTKPLISVSDFEGNKYTGTQIGTQIWLNSNLRSTKLNNGTSISYITDNLSWANLTSSAYCVYDNNSSNSSKFGNLYNFYTVSTGKLCPIGWHVPTKSDWTILISFLGGANVAGGKLKSPLKASDVFDTSIIWNTPNIIDIANMTNFSALPGGYRSVQYSMFDGWISNGYAGKGANAHWWSSTIDPNGYTTNLDYHYSTAFGFGVDNIDGQISDGSSGSSYKFGFSVRCIKD